MPTISETLLTPDAVLAAHIGSSELDRNLSALPPQADLDIQPVVGIGGSAGSIKPLQQFFAGMAPDSGLAFVVVLHLSPDAESSLPQIIQARTQMPVVQVLVPTRVEANHIYVIPPGQHLAMRDGHVWPVEPEQPRGRRVAVDLFFRTLAASHCSRAVAVVLSGLDSDGSIGIQRIKEGGGLTIAQDPGEAEYDGMPRSALETGMVDWVLGIEAMPPKLVEFMSNEMSLRFPAAEKSQRDEAHEDPDEAALREILDVLQARTGHDFSHYKRPTILRRIGRRLQVNSLSTFPQYAEFLRSHPSEARALLQDLLISVTNFFRDKEAFAALEAELPSLFQHKGPDDTIRAWVSGCATGEEAYSVAMLLLEHASKLPEPPKIQIFATDIDEEAMRFAREGLYPEAITADVSPERLRRFFHQEHGRRRVKEELRALILFASHNLLKDSPFSRLDLVTCRNLLIYFGPSAQDRALSLFHFALKPESLLFLGTSEGFDEDSALFSALNKKHRVFTRRATTRPPIPPLPLLDSTPAHGILARVLPTITSLSAPSPSGQGTPAQTMSVMLPASPNVAREQGAASFGALHLQLLEQYAPPSVLINDLYDVLHLSPRAGKYLSLSPGEISTNLLSLALPMLRMELRTALFRATQSGQPTDATGITIEVEGSERVVDISVRPMRDAAGLATSPQGMIPGMTPGAVQGGGPHFFLVVFSEAAEQVLVPASRESEPLARQLEPTRQLEAELGGLKSHLRETVEQYEASGEELRANNEELQAINEELHSTGEELETSQEEIRAVNEELSTLNQELRSKVEEVSRANADLHNLMSSTDIATVFLDRQLRIHRYTPRALDLFQIIPTDRGRPLSDLRHHLRDEAFAQDAAQVLETLRPIEREVSSVEGHHFVLRVLPYRTLEDRIDGVVLTFMDITQRKQAEEALHRSEADFRTMSNAAPALIWVCAPDGRGLFFNKRWYEFSGQSHEEAAGLGWSSKAHPDDWARSGPEWDKANLSGEPYEGEVRLRRADGQYFWHAFRALPRRNSEGSIEAWYGCCIDIHGAKMAEAALRETQERMGRALEIETVGVIFFRADGSITYANQAFRRLSGYSHQEAGSEAEPLRWDKMTPPEFMAQSHHAIAEFLDHGRAAPYEKQYIRRDGSRWWALCSVTQLSETEGAEFTIDISAHKQAEAELGELHGLLRLQSQRSEEIVQGLGGPGDFFYVLDEGFHFTQVNDRAAQSWGRAREELLGRHFWTEFPQAVGSEPQQAHFKAMQERRTVEFEGRSAITGRWIQATMRPSQDGGLLVYGRDVHELREAEEKLHIAVEAGELGTWDWDVPRNSVKWNQRHFLLFGMKPHAGAQTPSDFSDRLHPEDFERVLGTLNNAVEQAGIFKSQFRIVRESDGAVRWMSGYGRTLESQDGRATRMSGVVFDATERHQAEEVLRRSHQDLEQSVAERTRELARVNQALEAQVAERKRAEAGREMLLRRLVSAQEEERRRISRELHDQMGQTLTALMMGLKSLPDIPDTGLSPPSPNETISRLQHITTELMNEVHHLAWELRPAVLDNLGLEAALGQHVAEWSRRSGIRADFLSHGMTAERLPEYLESALYRTVQEALTNVARHSGASHASVLLERVEGEVVAIIEDDGAGFDPEALGESGSGRLGLAGMRERVDIASGTLTIESSPGAGTTVYARVPIER